MDALIEKLPELSRSEEARLFEKHDVCFKSRVKPLDAVFYPGAEKSRAAMCSLSGGAYTSFRNEPTHDGEPAFLYARGLRLPTLGFLYYWRSSATMAFLKREGSETLRARLNLLRATRVHLQEGFVEVGTQYGESLWAPSAGFPSRQNKGAIDIRDRSVELGSSRGKAAIHCVFAAYGVSLTRAEIASALGLTGGDILAESEPDSNVACEFPRAEEAVFRTQVRERVRDFWDGLAIEERHLMLARRWDAVDEPPIPFRTVADQLGKYGAENWRLKERRVLRRFAEVFPDREEASDAASELIGILEEERSA